MFIILAEKLLSKTGRLERFIRHLYMNRRTTEKHALAEIDNYMAEGGTITRAKSHHKGTSHLQGGDDYRPWKRKLKIAGGIAGALLLVFACYRIALILNVGEVASSPEAPSAQIAENAFKTSTPPSISSMKYVGKDALAFSELGDVQVGRVVTKNGESGYTCSVKADVKFRNSSVEATSRVNVTYNYNSLLNTWEAAGTEIESSNFAPIAAPDQEEIQSDLMNLITEYNKDSADKIQGAEITKEGDLSETGGTLTFTLTKKESGAEASTSTDNSSSNSTNGTNSSSNSNSSNNSSSNSNTTNNTNAQNLPSNNKAKQDLVETVKVRVAWSDMEGWEANIIWLGTKGETSTDTTSTDKEENKEETEEDATMELSCSSGSLVQLEGTVNGNQLKTAVTKFTIDGQSIVTSNIALAGDYSKYSGSATVIGTITTNGSSVTLTVQ